MNHLSRSSLSRMHQARRAVNEWLRTFFPAESLGKYGDFGYFLLALPLVALNLFLLSVGPQMQQVLSRLPSWGRILVSILFETIPLPTEDERKLTLGQLVLVVYIFIWFSPFARRWIGEAFADGFCRLYEGMIAAAGWCIRHRWWSFLFVLLLFVALVAQINAYAEQVVGHHQKISGFDQLVAAIERATAESRIDGSEAESFRELMDQWDPSSKRVLTPGQFSLAESMYKFFSVLYEGHDPKRSWLRHLLTRRETLKEIYGEAFSGPVAPNDVRSLRMRNVMNLMMARIHIRMGRDDCSDLGMILEGHSFLKRVTLGVAQPSFTRTVANDQGNIYNCLLSELLRSQDSVVSGDVYAKLLAICSSHTVCLRKALDAYSAAAEGAETCSLGWRRKLNNEIDIKIQLALRFASLPPAEDGEAIPPWLSTSEGLAVELTDKARDLLECNRSEPVVPLVLVTAAQAFGASASLWPLDSQQRRDSLRTAGVLLRISSSYRPHDIDDGIVVFCSALEGGQLNPDFVSGINILPELGGIDVPRFERSIRRRCQS